MGSIGEGIEHFGQQVGNFVGMGTGMTGFNYDESAFNPNAQEQALTGRLEQRSMGQMPSLAEQQMMAGLQAGQAQAMGTAAAQRGINPALAARLAQQQQGAMAAQTNQQAGMMRAQEQMANDQLLQQALQSQRQGRMSMQAGKAGAFETQADRASGTIRSIGQAFGLPIGEKKAMAEGGMITHQSPMMLQPDNSFNAFAAQIGAIVGQQAARQAQMEKQGGNSWVGDAMNAFMKKGAEQGMPMTGGPADGLNPAMMMTASEGAVVPGQAQVKGDSLANDKVPTMLSPGEIVVPRSVSQRSPEDIAKFVMALRGY